MTNKHRGSAIIPSLFPSLHSAIRCAILHGTRRDEIKPDRWGETYHCTGDDVRAAWDEVWADLRPAPNSIDDDNGEGK